jgi:putative toxin-antitoxin system antitoxin component (TIGR02293 family)
LLAPKTRGVKAPGGIVFSTFVDVFRAEPLTRVQWIKHGLPADFLDQLSRKMNMPKERLLPALGIAPATVRRKVLESKPLSSDDSERALGMARLVGQVESMVQESGDVEGFNAAEWLAQWLEEPLAALGGERPADLMDTAEGQAMVANLLARMQSGAYA